MVAFQSRLHSIGHGNCSRPCEATASAPSTSNTSNTEAPSEECGTALPGEACYGHVEWAMQDGITLHPEWYPDLTRNSTFEEFQAHLHSINYGCCPEPCPSPQPTPSPAKRQCCGVNQLSEMPVVCSLDVGCPPESYSWRECPAAGAAATVANSSSNAEAGHD